MTTFTVSTKCGASNEFDSRADAKQGKETHCNLCGECSESDVEIKTDETATDGGPDTQPAPPQEADVVDEPETVETLPDERPSVDTDPLTWIPEEFQDTIDGTVAINRKGFEVLAHHYNISCETDMVERTDEIVIHKAEARTDDGTLYTAYGEAHASEDTTHQLVRMSDTRAFKRAVSRATGIGMVAVEELQNEL